MIRTENLTRIFRTEEIETIALNGVNINVKNGEFVAIMGPSGCGKSTLLNILGLLDTPTEGKYWLGDEEVGHLKERERTAYRKGRIGFVFQNFNLIDELTVEENIDLQLKYLGIGKAERKERVLDILRKVKLSHRAKHYPHQLSGGQQQRVAIARALAAALLKLLYFGRQSRAEPTSARPLSIGINNEKAVLYYLRSDIQNMPPFPCQKGKGGFGISAQRRFQRFSRRCQGGA